MARLLSLSKTPGEGREAVGFPVITVCFLILILLRASMCVSVSFPHISLERKKNTEFDPGARAQIAVVFYNSILSSSTISWLTMYLFFTPGTSNLSIGNLQTVKHSISAPFQNTEVQMEQCCLDRLFPLDPRIPVAPNLPLLSL